jgi:hypothetical protein
MAFGTEELSSYGAIWKSLAPYPEVVLHTLDARIIQLEDEQRVHIACGPDASAACFVRTADNMAQGAAILPRRPDIAWQRVTIRGRAVDISALRPEKSNDSRGPR